MPGKLVILSGPSGVGKDTLLVEWAKADPRVVRVVAYTTRSPRAGEVDGIDYRFVSPETFARMASDGDFLEHKEVHGNWYATPLRDMERLLADGRIAVLKIDVQGGLDAMGRRPDAISIFLEPPSMEELERRIRSRALDTPEQIERRLRNAHDEMAVRDRYHHRVVNDALPRAIAEIMAIVPA